MLSTQSFTNGIMNSYMIFLNSVKGSSVYVFNSLKCLGILKEDLSLFIKNRCPQSLTDYQTLVFVFDVASYVVVNLEKCTITLVDFNSIVDKQGDEMKVLSIRHLLNSYV